MASKQGGELSTKELEELLDSVVLGMDRLKTLYEQYFLGIQKQPPTFIHNDLERKLRDVQQLNIRNTGLRYRLATLMQKFGSYNSYWRRTLRQIENGTYARNLAKIGRDAARKGADIPEEILAAMPKRMREQVLRDRDAAIAIAARRNQIDDAPQVTGEPDDDVAAVHAPSPTARRDQRSTSGALILDDNDDLDFDQLFAAFQDDAPPVAPPPIAPPRPTRPTHAETQAITRPVPRIPLTEESPIKVRTPPPTDEQTRMIPRVPGTPPPVSPTGPTMAIPRVLPPNSATTVLPKVPVPAGPPTNPTTAIPRVPLVPAIPRPAPSQASRPNPIAPGSSTQAPPTPVESMNGPFPRPPVPGERPVTQAVPRVTPTSGIARPGISRPPGAPPPGPPRPPAPAAPMRPPPGMTEADVNALHAKYVQAKQAVGEKVDASSRDKLLRTINQTAPKIMEQYKASGVDFSVVVKDNQVVIKAKPKT